MVILIHQMYYLIQIKKIHVMQRTVHILNYIMYEYNRSRLWQIVKFWLLYHYILFNYSEFHVDYYYFDSKLIVDVQSKIHFFLCLALFLSSFRSVRSSIIPYYIQVIQFETMFRSVLDMSEYLQ